LRFGIRAWCFELCTLFVMVEVHDQGGRRKLQSTKYKAQSTKHMQLARVIGTVVATIKNESLHGRKLLVVQTLDRYLQSTGKPMVAVDAVGAGVGELVFWCRGKEASFPFKREDTPTDCTIVGIVDSESHVNV
jgi:ethanolamine utilization protein EutN